MNIINELKSQRLAKQLKGISRYYGYENVINAVGHILIGYGKVTPRRLDTLNKKQSDYLVEQTKKLLRLIKKKKSVLGR